MRRVYYNNSTIGKSKQSIRAVELKHDIVPLSHLPMEEEHPN